MKRSPDSRDLIAGIDLKMKKKAKQFEDGEEEIQDNRSFAEKEVESASGFFNFAGIDLIMKKKAKQFEDEEEEEIEGKGSFGEGEAESASGFFNLSGIDLKMKKKAKQFEEEEEEEEEIEDHGSFGEGEVESASGFSNLDENLLFEVLKHVDATTLGRAACVSKQWRSTTQDERLWELICTRHLANIGCGSQQLRSVVLALGGFRRLHSQFLWPLSKPQSSSAAFNAFKLPPILGSKPPAQWGKDEIEKGSGELVVALKGKDDITWGDFRQPRASFNNPDYL